MTWILYHQISFGPFFPNGTYTDADEKREAEFNRIATPEMKENYAGSLGAFRRENSLQIWNRISPAPEFLQMSRFEMNRPMKDLADIMTTENQLMVVSEAVREIVAELEPDTHQFWPVEFVTSRGQPGSDKTFFAMNVLTAREVLRADQSGVGSVEEQFAGAGFWHIKGHKKELLRNLAVSEAASEGAQIYYDRRALGNAYFLSDQLSEALQGRGLKLPPKFCKCVTVQ